MVPKTERFEMRLDSATIERVDDWRARQGDLPSRAEAVRRLVEEGLSAATSENFRLTNTEKLTTWLLTEILKNQKGYEDKDTIELIQESISGGHFWAMEWELSGILHNHVDNRKNVSLVVDTLDMWSFIERAYEGFSEADKKRLEAETGAYAKNPKFFGFDGNNESEYMSIARFLVEKMGRFESFKGRKFNSHMPVVDRYREMTDLFEPIRKTLVGRELSVDQVIELLKRY